MLGSKISKEIYIITLARTLIAAGNFVFPFLALYLVEKLGLSPDLAGTFFFGTAITALIAALLGSWLADHWGRKKLVVAALLCVSAAFGSVYFIQNNKISLAFVALGITFMSSWQPGLNALIADNSPLDRRKDAFSLVFTGVTIGFAIATLIGSVLFRVNPKLIFLGNACAVLMGALLIHFSVRNQASHDSSHARQEEEKPRPGSSQNFWRDLFGQKSFLMILFAYSLHPIIFSQLFFYFPLVLNRSFGAQGTTYFGIMMALSAIIGALLLPFFRKVMRRSEVIPLVVLGVLIYTMGLFLCFSSNRLLSFALASILWSIGEMLSVTNFKVYLTSLGMMRHRARLSVLYEILYEVGFGLGPMAMGFITIKWGLDKIPLVMALGAFLSSFIFLTCRHSNSRRNYLAKRQYQRTGDLG